MITMKFRSVAWGATAEEERNVFSNIKYLILIRLSLVK